MITDKIRFSKDDTKNKEIKKNIFCILIVTLATIIYSFGFVWFIKPANLYSGGVTGLAQLIVAAFEKIGWNLDLGIFVLILNIPILIYGWKAVSKRFVICSIISIAIQTVMLSDWCSKLVFVDLGINTGEAAADNQILLAFLGGFVCGFGAALALRYGTSTGGVDILAQALAFKKHISIGYMSLIVNVLIAFGGALLHGNMEILFYTIIRIIVQSVITDKIHTSYNYLKVEIICDKGDEIAQYLIGDIRRGVTTLVGQGAFTHQTKSVLETYVSSYEANKVLEDVRKIDPKAFVTITPVKSIHGNFERKTIA